ncbi:maleylpyruvate isomerase family mycothiol-dependent enzyme [Corynebacterium stationis]|uniref:maleylpyruvate isomerase family mycothiol-dependent enzyme n=2 Tax=Corynebacterium stationis TaxID=1705 RepID=UPI00261A3C81|nr:maleylpyruvate isomerase family mycothiol-dependent enzyme [Corynebacterium stationis]
MTTNAQSFHDLSIEERLSIVRRGTAHYSGQLSLVDSDDFGEPTLLPDWDRSTVIAHVAYNANALVNLVEWATTGEEKPMYPSPDARNKEIAFGRTLNPEALRNLHDHTLVRLDVAWRDAPESAWSHQVKTAQGRDVPMSETLWMRTREVWLHAVDLNVTAKFTDIPNIVLSTLVPEIVNKWRTAGTGQGLVLVNSDTSERFVVEEGNETAEVVGTTAGLVRWASGRGVVGVNADAPQPPRWL